mmetsp:Transcript_47212/g.142960  ORF Transcript_47212/g.142960 Transcript_47212/m.142960 type:complete len:343 (+) Transcript_47212:175-1203(+)
MNIFFCFVLVLQIRPPLPRHEDLLDDSADDPPLLLRRRRHCRRFYLLRFRDGDRRLRRGLGLFRPGGLSRSGSRSLGRPLLVGLPPSFFHDPLRFDRLGDLPLERRNVLLPLNLNFYFYFYFRFRFRRRRLLLRFHHRFFLLLLLGLFLRRRDGSGRRRRRGDRQSSALDVVLARQFHRRRDRRPEDGRRQRRVDPVQIHHPQDGRGRGRVRGRVRGRGDAGGVPSRGRRRTLTMDGEGRAFPDREEEGEEDGCVHGERPHRVSCFFILVARSAAAAAAAAAPLFLLFGASGRIRLEADRIGRDEGGLLRAGVVAFLGGSASALVRLCAVFSWCCIIRILSV